MAKKMTLKERAIAAFERRMDGVGVDRVSFWAGVQWGHRANRLTRAERAVVRAAVAMLKAEYKIKIFEGKYRALIKAVAAYERAKGGAR
jgi:hypothetical protein